MKDSLKNLLETGDFVVNMVSAEMARDMVLSSAEYPPDQSEFEVLGLTPLPSVMVAAPRLGESKVSMECRLLKVIELGSNNLVLGEVLCAHVDDGVLTGGLIDVEKLQPLARLGGQLYAAICNPFEIERP